MERLNNPMLVLFLITAFIALALYASLPHEAVGYSIVERNQMGALIIKACKPVSDKERRQLAELFNTHAE